VTVLTRADRKRGEADHLWPEMLPDGRAVLFTIMSIAGGLDAAQIAVLDLSTGTRKTLVRGGTHARYVHSGHLVYSAGSALRAVGFDLDRLETRGSPVPVLPHLVTTPAGAADFAVAADGTLVYVDAPAGVGGAVRTLTWVDRMGREQPIAAPPRAYMHPRLSPDTTRVAVWADDQESDIWMWDLSRATLSRFTLHPGLDNFPVWTSDGRRVIFGSDRGGALNVFWQAADGTGAPERLTEGDSVQLASGVSPDGTWAIYSQIKAGSLRDVMMTTLTRLGRAGPPSQSSTDPQARSVGDVRPLAQAPFEERNGIVSPDGRWLAYEADASGRFEVYVRPFPNVADGQWQVSTGGGVQPLWARNGSELFFLAADGALSAVSVEARGAGWSAGGQTKILEPRYFTGGLGASTTGRTYDVSPDGRRFLMIKQGDGGDQTSAPPQIVVVQNWFEELKRLVPVN
jgi:serine/threonine-protein kinase